MKRLLRCIIPLALIPVSPAQDDTVLIHIRLIDGRTGLPMKVREIELEDRTGYREISVRQDQSGIATLRIGGDASILTHNTQEYVNCADERGGLIHNDYKVARIVSSGIVEPIEQPNLCTRTPGSAEPGELVLFVRPWRPGEDMLRRPSGAAGGNLESSPTNDNDEMKLVFCGTPRFAVPTLEALIAAGHEIPLVISQPDRPVGRKQELTAPPVKHLALVAGLPVTQPERIRNNEEFRAQIEAIAPDAIVVVAYGRIVPSWMLKLPRLGCINLHASLLPKYRGAAPIQWAIAMGENITGNTTMLLEEGLDTGPILMQRARSICPEETAVELFEELAVGGAPLVVQTLAGLENGTMVPLPQEQARATLAPILTREDGRMDFAARTATELKNRWRGFQPWPGAFTFFDGKKLIVHRMDVANAVRGSGAVSREPGSVMTVEDARISVACAQNTWLELVEVQLEGRKRVSAAEFLRGFSHGVAKRLG